MEDKLISNIEKASQIIDDEKPAKKRIIKATTNTAQKDELELQKIRLEIGEMQKSWWKQAAYLRAYLPPLASIIIVLAAGWITGFFDKHKLRLESEKHELTTELMSLRSEIDSLNITKNNLAKNLQSTILTHKKEKENFKFEIQKRKSVEEKLKGDKDQLIAYYKTTIDDYETRIKGYIETIQKYEQEKKSIPQASKSSVTPPKTVLLRWSDNNISVEEHVDEIDQIIATIKNNDLKLEVIGCNIGEAIQDLGLERAKNCYEYITSKGIDKSRVSYSSERRGPPGGVRFIAK